MIVVGKLSQDECAMLRLHGGSPDVLNPERLPDDLRAVAWDIWDRRPDVRDRRPRLGAITRTRAAYPHQLLWSGWRWYYQYGPSGMTYVPEIRSLPDPD
jgi:hypothetical protein